MRSRASKKYLTQGGQNGFSVTTPPPKKKKYFGGFGAPLNQQDAKRVSDGHGQSFGSRPRQKYQIVTQLQNSKCDQIQKLKYDNSNLIGTKLTI